MTVGCQLYEQLGPVEQIVDVAGADHTVLAEREVVHPALVGDRPGVRLHDPARPVRPPELERDHGFAGGAGLGDRGEELGRPTDRLDHQTDDRGERVSGEHGDVVGEVAHRLVARRHGDRHAERPLLGRGERGTGEEPALGDDAHPSGGVAPGDGEVEPAAGEQVRPEWHVPEAGAVGSDDGDVRPRRDVEEPGLQVGAGLARLDETRGGDHHTPAPQCGRFLDDIE